MGQFEWESSNLHISYPFEQPGVPGLNDVFVDALIIDPEQSDRVKLSALSVTAWDAGSITIDVRYLNDDPFFPSGAVLDVELYGTWAIVHLRGGNREFQLIMNADHTLPITVSTPVAFVARVQEDDPKSISSVEVTDTVTSLTYVLTGDIELASGYNIGTQSAEPLNPVRAGGMEITLDSVPGAGLGVAPSDCAPPPYLRSINTVGPDEKGRFIINCKSCYSGVIPCITGSPETGKFDPLPASIQLCNDCEQCCKCTDYENMYKALQRIHDTGRNSGLRMARTIDDFNDLLGEVRDQKSKREVPSMDLMLRPAHGYKLGVQINLLNNGVFTDIQMDKDNVDDALVKMLVSSTDVDMTGAVVLVKSCYLYNNVYGNPWLHVDVSDIMVNPADVSNNTDIGIIVKYPLTTPQSGKLYHVIKTTQFISIFFEIYWKDDVTPENDDVVNVTLTSSIFKPYTLEKTEQLIQPFDPTDPK